MSITCHIEISLFIGRRSLFLLQHIIILREDYELSTQERRTAFAIDKSDALAAIRQGQLHREHARNMD